MQLYLANGKNETQRDLQLNFITISSRITNSRGFSCSIEPKHISNCSFLDTQDMFQMTLQLFVWPTKVDKNVVFSTITNSFSNITNSFSNITNSFSNITNSIINITNGFSNITNSI